MKIISHRGNLDGPSSCENSPNLIQQALDLGYDVEVDVSLYKGELWLVNDKPQYKINLDYLLNDNIWCHAKDVKCIQALHDTNINYFYHSTDDVTITSKGLLWHHPNSDWKYLTPSSVAVCPEENIYDISKVKLYGICTDYVLDYKT